MKKFLNTLGITSLTIIAGLFLAFLLINLFLGCESWDKELWNDEHSCLTPSQIYEAIINE